jgi:hypothetical protein
VVTAARPSIVVIGDGLTESAFLPDRSGWGSLLAGNYTRKVCRQQQTQQRYSLGGACRPDHNPRHWNKHQQEQQQLWHPPAIAHTMNAAAASPPGPVHTSFTGWRALHSSSRSTP